MVKLKEGPVTIEVAPGTSDAFLTSLRSELANFRNHPLGLDEPQIATFVQEALRQTHPGCQVRFTRDLNRRPHWRVYPGGTWKKCPDCIDGTVWSGDQREYDRYQNQGGMLTYKGCSACHGFSEVQA